jgi:hypothetical protein
VLYDGRIVDEMTGSQLTAREIARRCLAPAPVPARVGEPTGMTRLPA